MTPSASRLRSTLSEFHRLHPETPLEDIVGRVKAESIERDWLANCRLDQLAPVETQTGTPWHTWLLLGGRGSGKTRAGAEWVRAAATERLPLVDRRSHRIALIGETIGQVRSVMIE